MCDFIISYGDDGADAYVSGIAQIDGNDVIWATEVYSLTMHLNYDELTVTEDGTNTYYGSGFAGTYMRNDTDPYSVPVRETIAGTQLPDTVSTTVINGGAAVLYIDPDDRFTATVPDIFSSAPEGEQPEEGIYLSSIDHDVFARIELTAEGGVSAEELKAALEKKYGTEADLFVDGVVAIQFSVTEDGEEWVVVIYACVMGEDLAVVEYRYLASQADYYGQMLDQLSLNVN